MGCRIIRIKKSDTKKSGIGLWTLALLLALALASVQALLEALAWLLALALLFALASLLALALLSGPGPGFACCFGFLPFDGIM